MSIDLDWSNLDASYASSLIDILNRQLQSTPRPSFIGPIEITSFDFGSQPPVVELVDLRDIYRDFLEDDDGDGDDDTMIMMVMKTHRRRGGFSRDDEEYEWVSRRSARRGMAMEETAPMYYHHLPPHVRYASGPASDVYSAPPAPLQQPSSSSVGGGGVAATQVPAADEHPNLQLHLLVSWHSDLRLTLTTSLRINYPSPLFMSLPIKLSVTGLVFDGELAVAYEGGRRVHLCVLDGLDPYGPSAKRASGSQGSTPSDPEGDDGHAAKPLPVGQRLLPEIFIESELGQADKHVLKNVTRVEKFIQDVIRKTIEEELVFPNFHTLVLR
ncbi:hypothetical protein BGY98DRAFT_1160146 [Russula aff. rugulosa BPL654]|nr:hypothetical protein BGY98DRAFT_1160146 [Russula aff. rugulosa BPL654]